jgi:hypothetical protein
VPKRAKPLPSSVSAAQRQSAPATKKREAVHKSAKKGMFNAQGSMHMAQSTWLKAHGSTLIAQS